MTIPDSFLFNQSNLQDYFDCQRRFQLRYIEQLAWPAIQSEPASENELLLKQGTQFHQMVRQYFLNIPSESLLNLNVDENCKRWFNNFLDYWPSLTGLQNFEHFNLYPEHSLSIPFSRYRLIAQYDLILINPGRQALIIDWKTSQKKPKRKWLADRIQTHLYPFILLHAGNYLNGGIELIPDQIGMLYWFVNNPNNPESFQYTPKSAGSDRELFTNIINKMISSSENDFLLTQDQAHCRFCKYRSLCGRGVKAGLLNEIDQEVDDASLEPGIDQIMEVEF